ncbi:hypothetical protein E3N88_24634 [Mikania micrantha]|uniref:Uncharacterized protein n=1 Tax=Mikania micrantha TaxID=192012 RepID=A0A5N6N3U8_9ASTR|nr:hypothetical protein E3N88_24634 [Mikania micrantha]
MPRFFPGSILIWAIIIIQSLSSFKILSCSSSSWCHHHHIHQHTNRKFEQKTTNFWEFEEESKTWVQIKLPYDLVSCVNNNCTKVGVIEPVDDDQARIESGQEQDSIKIESQRNKKVKTDRGLGSRNRISLTKMSDDSIWVTGISGSIYERFWNGIQWVIAPHELPLQAGYAVSVFLVKHTILALSEAGILYQAILLNENSQPIWVDFAPNLDSTITIRIKSGVISYDREKIYFCTKNGLLLELYEINTPSRWLNHGKPPGADVAAIVDAAETRPQVIFTISSTGDLYEFDPSSKPLWKKHIWSQELTHDTALTPSTGCTAHQRTGPHSDSIFLLTKGGNLVERRLNRRKWKWVVHGSPKDQQFTSMTLVTIDEAYTSSFSLFLATVSGSVVEYNISKQEGKTTWVNHAHPTHAKLAKGVAGLQFQTGRLIFPLDDGRLGELHKSKTGGDGVGPSPHVNRRRASTNYTWSIIDAPESEGWNAEYCTEHHGPLNCISGVKDEINDGEINRPGLRRRSQENNYYYHLVSPGSKSKEEPDFDRETSVGVNFRLRVVNEGQSFVLVTGDGIIFEYLNVENAWFWLKHEYHMAIKDAVGNYNGSLFLINKNNDLIVGERSGNEMTWINCSAMKKGRQVIGGPPWDVAPSRAPTATPEDSLFFVGRTGGLLQLTVALKKLKWKDCRNPSNTKIASIVDQEVFRENIVFVVGTDGHLYQYNKVTGLWHGHHQPLHMVLSRQPGTAMRGSQKSLSGSLFMISEDGRLVEYYWNPMDGWGWVEHGSPSPGVTLVGSTGPCLAGNQLFLIGSNGNVYLRYWDQTIWKWSDFGFPSAENIVNEEEEICIDKDIRVKARKEYQKETENCDPKVAPTRPIPFTEHSVIFELRDGRLAEIQRTENLQWVWWRTIGTPTTRCNAIYWKGTASGR